MRRTKARRRFHTERVIANRQRRYRRETPDWIRVQELPDGRLQHTNAYFDCGKARCGICHWGKFDPARRDRDKRLWRAEIRDELPS